MTGPRRIIDAHVHVFPDRLFKAIWAFFEANYWPVPHRLHGPAIAGFLKARGIHRFTTLNYAHKSGLSRAMNDWTAAFCNEHPEAIPFGTIHPMDPWVAEELERVLSPEGLDFTGIKLQLLVTDFDPCIREMDPVYEALVAHGKVLVMHAGTGPGANDHVGFAKLRPVLERYPRLQLQVPHLGSYEYDPFFEAAAEGNVYLDTAMIFIDHGLFDDRFLEGRTIDDLLDIQDKIMFGSDFPNVPYPYEDAIESIERLPVDDEVKEKIFHENATRLYDLGA